MCLAMLFNLFWGHWPCRLFCYEKGWTTVVVENDLSGILTEWPDRRWSTSAPLATAEHTATRALLYVYKRSDIACDNMNMKMKNINPQSHMFDVQRVRYSLLI